MPRRMRDRIRMIFAAQRRLDRKHGAGRSGREFYADACDLYELRLRAEGKPIPTGLREDPPVKQRTLHHPPSTEAAVLRRRRLRR